jgi:hypothetical protein
MVFILLFIINMGGMLKGAIITESSLGTRQNDPLKGLFVYFGPLSNFPKKHHAGPKLRFSIPNECNPHCGAYE